MRTWRTLCIGWVVSCLDDQLRGKTVTSSERRTLDVGISPKGWTSLMGKSVARALAQFFLVLLLATGLAGCSAAHRRQPVTRVEIDTTGSSKAYKRVALANLDVVIDAVVRERGRLVVATIDGDTLAHDTTFVDVSFLVDDGGNDLRRNRLVTQRRRQVVDQVAHLLDSPRTTGGSDVFGAVAASGLYLGQFPVGQRARVVFLSDMVNTAGGPGLNLTAGDWSQAPARTELIERLRTQGLLPDLRGVQVWAGGTGLTAGDALSGRQVQRIRSLWLALFTAAGARDVQYAADLVDAGEPPGGQS